MEPTTRMPWARWVPWLFGGCGGCPWGLEPEEVGNRGDDDSEGDLDPRRLGKRRVSPPLPSPCLILPQVPTRSILPSTVAAFWAVCGERRETSSGVGSWCGNLTEVWGCGRLREALAPTGAAHHGPGPGMIWIAETTTAGCCSTWARASSWIVR